MPKSGLADIFASRSGLARFVGLALLGCALITSGCWKQSAHLGMLSLFGIFFIGYASTGQQGYDLLLKGGHVIDGKNNINAIRDVAMERGKIAAVEPSIDPGLAFKTVDVSGLYVTPGLVDIHLHVYTYTGGRGSYADDIGIMPDGFTFRTGVTTVVDAGTSGWRTFEDFKTRVIDRSRTRVLALVNIVGHGKQNGKYDQDLEDMDAKPTAEMALRHKGIICGIKTADFIGPEWTPFEHAVEAGRIADIPVMLDFGEKRKERSLHDLFTKVLRPGDIYTHLYSGLRGEVDENGMPGKQIREGRQRGVFFDLGHGRDNFSWSVAVPMLKAGFPPDSFSTDLHSKSMNSNMKDMLNVMGKFMAMGMPLDSVILRATWNPAKAVRRLELGNLSTGNPADVAVLRLVKGKFGFVDSYGGRLDGTERLICELTVRDGKVVYDLNGITRELGEKLPPHHKAQDNSRWDAYA
jgi:dihydroorotase